jgi:hypothetical protein
MAEQYAFDGTARESGAEMNNAYCDIPVML